ncbi:conjugative relaxase [Budviciaceae bacterium CWB-B4]|uniref:Conjugative relaxase n=1 Tax=Limnobaculum xujianqingii TaxID=2738837 RepID=A0A9D7AFB3_9GAMM|nr:MobF family relaxase [Limnobaculum xujianqingii]MBK5071629.1 conjugative relaxase [Limnobaculum xujianqingii]MBK5174938.1 conjugative relaxase [Limnobaculum xujianqingii]
MLTVTPITGNNAYAAAHYFSAADDYYPHEHGGEWYGQGAEALGLQGDVDRTEFARLLRGQLPNGEHIPATIAKDEKKRMGLDLTFSAPKSVSMQALIGDNQAILAAHSAAVRQALQHVEPLIAARRKVDGKSYRERTGNMVAGLFRHEMSRAKDPQLHTHAVVLNVTQRHDGAWRALSNDAIFQVQHQIDAIYKMYLARELQALGYSLHIAGPKGDFELAHISREQIEAFSQRSQVIEEALAKHGKTRADATALEKQIISLATRPRKDERDRALIKQYWAEKSQSLNIDYHPQVTANYHYSPGQTLTPDQTATNPAPSTSAPAAATGNVQQTIEQAGLDAIDNMAPARIAVAYAVHHLAEREQVFDDNTLKTIAMQRSVGQSTPEDIQAEINRLIQHGGLIAAPPTYQLSASETDRLTLSAAGWQQHFVTHKQWTPVQAKQYVADAIQTGMLTQTDNRYTTPIALKREQIILAIERNGRGQVTPILAAPAMAEQLRDTTLTPGQQQSIELMIGTANRIIGIQGDAGTGKTHALRYAIDMTEQAGYKVVAIAPYGNQVKALKEHGLDAHTLASFLNTKRQTIDSQTVVVLDEAGVVPARQMQQLLQKIERSGARLVMIGDTKQTEAIEAGKPFWQLQNHGMTTVRINEIQRQTNPELKRAVELVAGGNTAASLAKIRHIEHQPDDSLRRQSIVADYMTLTPDERKNTLIIAGTHDARNELNAGVREALALTGKGNHYATLIRLDTTQAQRQYAASYMPGQILQPERDYPRLGLQRGQLYSVKEALPGNRLRLICPDKTEIDINPKRIKQLSVYAAKKVEFSVGDLVRVNRNDAALDLTNGDRFYVTQITAKSITLQSDEAQSRQIELLTNRPLHLEYAYASTIHGSQGLTCDRVLIELTTFSRTTSQNLYYVAISRARQIAQLYTNSLRHLPKAIARRYDKSTALSIQRARQMERKGMAGGKSGLEKKPKGYGLER